MSPNMRLQLKLEPISFSWNGRQMTISSECVLLPDNQVRYLHKRVLATRIHDRHKLPIFGKVVGQAVIPCSNNTSFWLVECEDTGRLIRTRKPRVIE